MSQLQLVEIPDRPKLTVRQQRAYDEIVRAGFDGLHTDELGAFSHSDQAKHPSDDRCRWCGQTGMELGKALRAKGLVQQRRRRTDHGTDVVWTVAGKLPRPELDGMTDQIPF